MMTSHTSAQDSPASMSGASSAPAVALSSSASSSSAPSSSKPCTSGSAQGWPGLFTDFTPQRVERLLGPDRLGHDIRKLGFGLMRLPKLADGSIDVEQTAQMADEFLAAGFTYFDTAYVYPGSEEATRKALVERHPRDSYTLATKLFASREKSAQAARDQFRTSLERTGAGYFDFYLMHNLGQARTAYFEDWGLWDFTADLKRQGLIRHMGFSMHASADELDAVLSAHPEVDFVQLQVNYADWDNPVNQSRAVWECALSHGKPVVIMEPVKGGLLANPPAPVASVFQAADPDASCASWALRFAASLPGVVTVLSGMSNLEQLRDNLATFSPLRTLDDADAHVLGRARQELARVDQIACTSCGYCKKDCPQSIPIPQLFSASNVLSIYGNRDKAQGYFNWAVKQAGATASDCIACGTCESVCPQQLPVIELLEGVAQEFE